MAAFDLHEKCARCRKKKVGDDLCVKGQICVICEGFSDSQHEMLSTSSCKICKDKRTGTLVSPKDVTVISSVGLEEQVPSYPTAHPPAQAPAPSTSSQLVSYVTSAQFEEMSDKWAEHFARFEALLSRGNVFSIPKSSAPVSSHPLLSDQPFLNPSAQPTGPVVNPAEQDSKIKLSEPKPKKKSRKSTKGDKSKDTVVPDQPVPASSIPGPGDFMQEPVFRPVSSVSSSATSQQLTSTGPSEQTLPLASQPGPGNIVTVPSSHQNIQPTSTAAANSFAGAGDITFPPEQDYRDPPEQQLSDEDFSDEDFSGAEEGEVSSDNIEKQEQTEDLTFRETVRSIRSFMGWDHIPVFVSDLAEPDKSNNPRRGSTLESQRRSLSQCPQMIGFAKNWRNLTRQ